jgi:hypothetical protein
MTTLYSFVTLPEERKDRRSSLSEVDGTELAHGYIYAELCPMDHFRRKGQNYQLPVRLVDVSLIRHLDSR